jgi:predicted membrane metal-binding protein
MLSLLLKQCFSYVTNKLPLVWAWLKTPIQVARGLVLFLSLFFVLTVRDGIIKRTELKQIATMLAQNQAFEAAQRKQVELLRIERKTLTDTLNQIIIQKQQLDSSYAKLYKEIANWSDADRYRFWQHIGAKHRTR